MTATEKHALPRRKPGEFPGSGEHEMTVAQTSRAEASGKYRHEAFLYSGLAEFLAGTTSFIRRAVSAGDPVLVVLSGGKIDLLRRRLGPDAVHVGFADMTSVGDNPGRIIAVWRAFVAANAGSSQLWGIGEPVHSERSQTELAECQLHEALLNVAFDAATPFWLLCPYDLEALTADVIEEAHRSHPFVARGDEHQACGAFRRIDLAAPFDRPVPPRPADTDFLYFETGDLRRVRAFVAEHADRAGLDQDSAGALALAVSEVATNSIRHGGGHGELRAWICGRSLVCEVSDHGHITLPLVGRVRPAPDADDGAGLWVANQLCDLVQIYSSRRGTTVRLHTDL